MGVPIRKRVCALGVAGALVSMYAYHVEHAMARDPFYEPSCVTRWGSCASVFSAAPARSRVAAWIAASHGVAARIAASPDRRMDRSVAAQIAATEIACRRRGSEPPSDEPFPIDGRASG